MAAEMKRGQVAIWVILGLALVGSIILFFLLSRYSNILTPEPTGIADAKSFIRQCVSEHTKEVVNEILPRGGFLAPRNSIFYNEYDVEYICENVGVYHKLISYYFRNLSTGIFIKIDIYYHTG